MNRWLIGGIAGLGALVVAGGATAYALNAVPAPEPTPTVVAVVVETPKPTVTPTPTPTPTPEPVVEVAVPVPVVEEPVYVEPEPAGPVLCPGGTMANSSDGYNDTTCIPEICFHISVPNPEHPECDQAMPPEYYY